MAIFIEEELLVLANMVGHQELLGIPNLAFYRLNESAFIEKGIQELKKKELLDKNQQLTKKGYLVASLIEKYGASETYLCLDETYYVATLKESIVLKKRAEGYQLTIQEPEALLGQWLTEYQILRRTPLDEEVAFRSKRTFLSVEQIKEQGIAALLTIGSVQRRKNLAEKNEFILLLSNEKLFQKKETTIKQVSQYWLTKWLVDKLNVPYELPEEVKNQRRKWFE